MTNEELDIARAIEAERLWIPMPFHERTLSNKAIIIAARLGREGWMPNTQEAAAAKALKALAEDEKQEGLT
jgi:hypothetical protein